MAEFKSLTICSNPGGVGDNNSANSRVPKICMLQSNQSLFSMMGNASDTRDLSVNFLGVSNEAALASMSNPIELATGDISIRSATASPVVQDYLVRGLEVVEKRVSNDATYNDNCLVIDNSSYMSEARMEIHAGRIPAIFDDNSDQIELKIHPVSTNFKWISSAHFTPTLKESSESIYKSSMSSNLVNDSIEGSSTYFDSPKGMGAISRFTLVNYSINSDNEIVIRLGYAQSSNYYALGDIYYLVILTDVPNGSN